MAFDMRVLFGSLVRKFNGLAMFVKFWSLRLWKLLVVIVVLFAHDLVNDNLIRPVSHLVAATLWPFLPPRLPGLVVLAALLVLLVIKIKEPPDRIL